MQLSRYFFLHRTTSLKLPRAEDIIFPFTLPRQRRVVRVPNAGTIIFFRSRRVVQ